MTGAPTGLYGWIRSNDGRSTGLFLGFLLAVQLIAPLALVGPLLLIDNDHAPFFGWGGYLLRYAPLVLVASIVWFACQLWWHVETVKKAVGFHFVDATDEPRLCRLLEPLLLLTGLPVPFVGVIDSDARNAFACGVGRKKAVVVVTRGLIDHLSDAELEAVLAHELSHIKHGDIRLMAAANIFMRALTGLNNGNALRFSPIHGLLAIAVPAVLPLSLAGSLIGRLALRAGQVSRLLISSAREFIADAQAAQWTKDPGALAAALLKVDGRHHVRAARAEDDAMMIAGASEGPGATHPTVAARVAALARVTGSMVFNAPNAPRDGDWTGTTPREAVAGMGFGRGHLARAAIAQVRRGDGDNWLGLSKLDLVALVMTVGALIGIHWDQLNDGRAMAAKFDLRPIATMIGAPFACELSPFSAAADRRCDTGMSAGAYQAYEDQQGTLAGYLARMSRDRRARGVAHSDVSLMTIHHEERTPWEGSSGRLRGVSLVQKGESLFISEDGVVSTQPPAEAAIAELNQIGCFQTAPSVVDHIRAVDDENWGGATMRTLEAGAAQEAAKVAAMPTDASVLADYAARRQFLLEASWNSYGPPGLARIQAAFATPENEAALGRLRTLATDPARPTWSAVQFATIRALTRDPRAFVPCRSLAG